jgi:tetratricopeptide (TPR) repeat protein
MKKFVLLISVAAMALIGSSKVSAQGKYGPDSTECIKYLSYYTEYYKQKNYDAALPNWRQAYKYCPPTARYSMLSDGTTLLRNLIQKNQNNPVYKEQLVDSLMTLYNQRVEYWPKYAVSSLNNMALDMYNYMKDEPAKLLEGLTEVIAQTKSQTRPNIFLFQLNTAVDLYKKGMVDPETVINIYETGVQYLGEVKPKNDVEARSIEKTQTDFESIFITSQVASCDNLIALFTPRYEADPQNLDLSKNIVKMMSATEGCMDNDLFLNAVQSVYNLEPTYSSAYYLYRLYSSRSDFDNAVKYMEEAINSVDSDAVTDAGYYFELAAFCFKNGKSAKAYESAQKAVELDETIAGKAYMLMGTIWGSTICGGNEVEKRAPYWVAVDFMTKAKNADPALAEEANNYIRQYSNYYPAAAEAFMYDVVDGQSYTVSCGGMRAVTTVRTQK